MSLSDLTTAIASPHQALVELPRSIVLAIDGGTDCDAAIACASRLGEISGARIHVVSVNEPVPMPPLWPYGGLASLPPLPPDSEAVQSAQLARVRDQLGRLHNGRGDWAVAMRSGRMGPEVARFAEGTGAELIVVGRGRHGLVDRTLGEEHLTALLRESHVPVLAVDAGLRIPAKRVVIAVDFSERNIRTALVGMPHIDAEASVYLVHVKPDPPFGIPHPGRWIKSYEDGVRTGLASIRDQLPFPPTCTVESIVLNGHPGAALADFARSSRSELVIAGTHGAGFWNRLVIGSVTAHLLRSAMCSLLLVPSARDASE